MLQGQIKLSRIVDHNFDKRTDRLYEPLRQAVDTMPSLPSSEGLSAMKCSQINISRAEQDAIVTPSLITEEFDLYPYQQEISADQ
jgi:hypothetical protein